MILQVKQKTELWSIAPYISKAMFDIASVKNVFDKSATYIFARVSM